MASKNKNLAELLDANGDVLLSNLDNINVYDVDTTSTGQFTLSKGTTAERPGTSYTGAQRYNTDLGLMEFYDGSSWKKISAELAVLSSISGTIWAGVSGTDLTLNGTGFLSSSLDVTFRQSSDGIDETVTVTATNDTTATVAVPANVYNNVTAGNGVSVFVTNVDQSISGTIVMTASTLPTGGTITSSGNYRYHTFLSTGNFVTPASFNNKTVEYLLIAGGGGGGNDLAGGGGAGGLRSSTHTVAASTTYTATVGPGGPGATQSRGSASPSAQSGTDSSVFGVTSIGGGGGGSYGSGSSTGTAAGASGGSGGGASGNGGGTAAGGSGTAGQGNDGGDGQPYPSGGTYNYQGGGGGGAGAAGAAGGDGATNCLGGDGTSAYSAWATATSTGDSGYYAGGGGGGRYDHTSDGRATGGQGGGGDGGIGIGNTTTNYGLDAIDNTGGGGGGGTWTGSNPNVGGDGGDGLVIIRYDVTAI